jgi:putative heme-binding domain-containing protein
LEQVLDERVVTACTDGREVRFNPTFVESLAPAELDAVMIHEILHAALLHIPRRRERDPHLWNVAADIVVNGIILKQKGLLLPLNPCIDASLENYEVEEVYEILLKRADQKTITWIGADLLSIGEGEVVSESEMREMEAHWKQAWHQAVALSQSFGQGSVPQEVLRHMENIIDPSKVISDQYDSHEITKKDGSMFLGRIAVEENGKVFLMANPFAPSEQTVIDESDIAKKETRKISMMPPGLINSLNQDELLDLIAYLTSGGNKEDKMFAK